MNRKHLKTQARVYLDAGPVVHLAGRESACPRDTDGDGDCSLCARNGGCMQKVLQSQDELRREIVHCLNTEAAIESQTTDRDWIVIPAARVVDVVFPTGQPEPVEGTRDGTQALFDHGDMERALALLSYDQVVKHVAEAAFTGEVVVEYAALGGSVRVGIITGYDSDAGVFTIDQNCYLALSGPEEGNWINMVGTDLFPVQAIKHVLCWNLEDYATGGDVEAGQFTSIGLSRGPGVVLEMCGRRKARSRMDELAREESQVRARNRD